MNFSFVSNKFNELKDKSYLLFFIVFFVEATYSIIMSANSFGHKQRGG